MCSSFAWDVNDFDKLLKEKKNCECVESTKFHCLEVNNGSARYISWYIRVFPNHDNQACIDLYNSNDFTLEGKAVLGVQSTDVQSPKEKTVSGVLKNNGCCLYLVVPHSELQTFLVAGKTLRVYCKITMKENPSELKKTISTFSPLRFLQGCLQEMLSSGKHYDLSVNCGGKTIKCHKSILGARSTELEKLIRDTVTRNGVIDLQDVEENIFSDFLNFCYLGILKDINLKSAIQLLKLSKNFAGIEELENICVFYIAANLDGSNCVEVFKTAKLLEISSLREKALDIMFSHDFIDNMQELYSMPITMGDLVSSHRNIERKLQKGKEKETEKVNLNVMPTSITKSFQVKCSDLLQLSDGEEFVSDQFGMNVDGGEILLTVALIYRKSIKAEKFYSLRINQAAKNIKVMNACLKISTDKNTLVANTGKISIPEKENVINNDNLKSSTLEKNKSLIIECHVQFDENTGKTSGLEAPKCTTLDSLLMSMRKGKIFSDFTIRCKTKEFACHRNILSMHSDVFDSMFNSSMKESRDQTLDIVDLEPEDVGLMLDFLYSGNLQGVKENPINALIAGNKYDIKHMKAEAERQLEANLEKENALECLMLSEKFSCKSLKTAAMKQIAETGLSHVSEWKTQLKDCPELLIELIELMTLATEHK